MPKERPPMLKPGDKLIWGGQPQTVVSVNDARARISPANIDISPESPAITEDEYLALVISNSKENTMPRKKTTAPCKKTTAPKKAGAEIKAATKREAPAKVKKIIRKNAPLSKIRSKKILAIIAYIKDGPKTADAIFGETSRHFATRPQFNGYLKYTVQYGYVLEADGHYLLPDGGDNGK